MSEPIDVIVWGILSHHVTPVPTPTGICWVLSPRTYKSGIMMDLELYQEIYCRSAGTAGLQVDHTVMNGSTGNPKASRSEVRTCPQVF